MRTVQAIPVAKVNEVAKEKISGETIVKESGETSVKTSESTLDDPFVEVDFTDDVISREEMAGYISRL
jgi:hypothetical protein